MLPYVFRPTVIQLHIGEKLKNIWTENVDELTGLSTILSNVFVYTNLKYVIHVTVAKLSASTVADITTNSTLFAAANCRWVKEGQSISKPQTQQIIWWQLPINKMHEWTKRLTTTTARLPPIRPSMALPQMTAGDRKSDRHTQVIPYNSLQLSKCILINQEAQQWPI